MQRTPQIDDFEHLGISRKSLKVTILSLRWARDVQACKTPLKGGLLAHLARTLSTPTSSADKRDHQKRFCTPCTLNTWGICIKERPLHNTRVKRGQYINIRSGCAHAPPRPGKEKGRETPQKTPLPPGNPRKGAARMAGAVEKKSTYPCAVTYLVLSNFGGDLPLSNFSTMA